MYKKIFLFLSCQFVLITPLFSQFSVTHNSETYTSGIVLTTNSIVAPGNEIGFDVNNLSTGIFKFRVAAVELVNNDGSTMQVCIGTACYAPGVTVGEVFPSGANPISIPVGGFSYIHLISENVGIVAGPVDFKFKIYQVNDFNSEVGTPFYFTYRYDPSAMSMEDQQLNKVLMYPSLASDYVHIQAENEVKISIFDLQGRRLIYQDFQTNPTLDVSALIPQTYVLVAEDREGRQSSQKIIKM